MNKERQMQLYKSGQVLTKEEVEQGWHWCKAWDYMLVGPGQDEAFSCACDNPAIDAWKKKSQAPDNSSIFYQD